MSVLKDVPVLSPAKILEMRKAVSESTYEHPDVPGAGAKKRKKLKKKKDKVHAVMGEYKRGKLRSGSGAEVTSREQAVAIAMSEAGKSRKKKVKKSLEHEWTLGLEKGKKLPTGTIRDWKGKKYQKISDAKWAPVKEGKKTEAKESEKEGTEWEKGHVKASVENQIKAEGGDIQKVIDTIEETIRRNPKSVESTTYPAQLKYAKKRLSEVNRAQTEAKKEDKARTYAMTVGGKKYKGLNEESALSGFLQEKFGAAGPSHRYGTIDDRIAREEHNLNRFTYTKRDYQRDPEGKVREGAIKNTQATLDTFKAIKAAGFSDVESWARAQIEQFAENKVRDDAAERIAETIEADPMGGYVDPSGGQWKVFRWAQGYAVKGPNDINQPVNDLIDAGRFIAGMTGQMKYAGKIEKNNPMYERGVQDAIQFGYIPDFKSPSEKAHWEAGYGDTKRKEQAAKNITSDTLRIAGDVTVTPTMPVARGEKEQIENILESAIRQLGIEPEKFVRNAEQIAKHDGDKGLKKVHILEALAYREPAEYEIGIAQLKSQYKPEAPSLERRVELGLDASKAEYQRLIHAADAVHSGLKKYDEPTRWYVVRHIQNVQALKPHPEMVGADVLERAAKAIKQARGDKMRLLQNVLTEFEPEAGGVRKEAMGPEASPVPSMMEEGNADDIVVRDFKTELNTQRGVYESAMRSMNEAPEAWEKREYKQVAEGALARAQEIETHLKKIGAL